MIASRHRLNFVPNGVCREGPGVITELPVDTWKQHPLEEKEPVVLFLTDTPVPPLRIMDWRRTIGEVGLKRRYRAMSAGEVLHEQQRLEAVSALFAAAVDVDNPEEEEDFEIAGALLAKKVMDARIDRTVIRSVRGRSLLIADVVEQEAWGDYRFRKVDIRRLFNVLNFPPVWVCKNRCRFPGETALLLLLPREGVRA